MSAGKLLNPTPRTRHRFKGRVYPSSPIINTAVKGPNGGQNFVKTWYASNLIDMTVMADSIVPSFERRVGEGEIFFNPMDRVSRKLDFQGLSGWKVEWIGNDVNKGQTYEVDSNWFLALIGGLLSVPEAANANPRLSAMNYLPHADVQSAIIEATTKAHRFPSDANTLVTLAELHKTMRLVPDLLKSWSSLFRKINRSSTVSRYSSEWDNAKGLSASNLRAFEKTATETWLALRFGARPLIMDTLGLLKAINRVYNDEPVRLTSRGKSSLAKSSVVNGTGASYPIIDSFTQSIETSVSVRAMKLWEIKLDLANQSGLSLTAVPEAAIDLIKFSFVLNWVINVNDFFAALGSYMSSGTKVLGSCYVVDKLSTSVWQATGTISTDAGYVVRRQTAGIITATDNHRYRVVGLPDPKLAVRADPYKFLTDFRLLDAIALLRVQTRGRNVRSMASLSAQSGSF